MSSFKARLVFTVDPKQVLPDLSRKVTNTQMRIALSKGATVVKEEVSARTPTRLVHLRRSLRIKTRFYPKSGVWAAIIGPGSSYKRKGKKRTRGKHKGTRPDIRPAWYGQFVERGTRRSRSRAFLKPSIKSGDAFRAIVAAKLRQLIAGDLARRQGRDRAKPKGK